MLYEDVFINVGDSVSFYDSVDKVNVSYLFLIYGQRLFV